VTLCVSVTDMQVAVYACELNCFLLNTNLFTLQESQFYMHKFDITSTQKATYSFPI